jgi:hypothetical protein
VSWTYDATVLSDASATGRRNIVRLEIGDTDTHDQQLQDEEIDYFLGVTSDDTTLAALRSVEALIARYARQVTVTQGPASFGAQERVSHYERLRGILRQRVALSAPWYAGGRSQSEKAALAADTDAVQPAFRIGQDDHPGTGPTSLDEEV